MEFGSLPYIGGGELSMDKTHIKYLSEYSYHNQTLVMEHHFMDSAPIRNVIKQYILEQCRTKMEAVGSSSKEPGHELRNTAVIASDKEESR